MKVFFVADGKQDIGESGPHPFEPYKAGGPITTLVRKIAPSIAANSVACRWTELCRFIPDGRKNGYDHKVRAALLLAERKLGCDAAVFVADQDGAPEDRLEAIRAGCAKTGLKTVCGIAHQSIEAWTLGAPAALAEVLELPAKRVVAEYPPGKKPEELKESSENPSFRPKALLKRIAKLAHRDDSVALREEVAAKTDIEALARACPIGFAPFAAEVKQVLG